MKIAVFHELHDGGARRAANSFAKELRKRHTVDLYIVDEKEKREEKQFFHNVFFYKFIPKKWSGGNWKVKLYKDTIERIKLYNLHKKIARDVNARKYDIAFIHPSQYTQAPFVLQFITTKKLYYCEEPLRIIYEKNFAIDKELSRFKKIYEKCIRWILKEIDRKNIRCSDMILANSQNTQKNIKKAYGLKSTVSYLGVLENLFKPSRRVKENDILFIGSIQNIEGYPLLEKALLFMKYKPRIKLHQSGKDWISSEKDFVRLYTNAKVVVCLAKNEPFGLVPLEAMSCGVPVVAVDDGGYKESVVDGKTGFIIARDPKELAKKLDMLLLSQKQRERMGKIARDYIINNWTWEKQTKKLEEYLVSLVEIK